METQIKIGKYNVKMDKRTGLYRVLEGRKYITQFFTVKQAIEYIGQR